MMCDIHMSVCHCIHCRCSASACVCYRLRATHRVVKSKITTSIHKLMLLLSIAKMVVEQYKARQASVSCLYGWYMILQKPPVFFFSFPHVCIARIFLVSPQGSTSQRNKRGKGKTNKNRFHVFAHVLFCAGKHTKTQVYARGAL